MKKIICALLSVCLLLSLVPFSASALDDASGTTGSCTWSYNATTYRLTISGNGHMADYSAENPAPWKEYANSITSLSFEGNINNIGSYAFAGTRIVVVMIPGTVTQIGESAFEDCTALNNIFIYGSAQIGNRAFKVDSTEPMIPCTVSMNNVTRIGDEAFRNRGISELRLSEGLTSIGEYAFYNCTSLSDVKLPASLVTIGEYAFSNCRTLSDVSGPDSGPMELTSIQNRAFSGCTNLVEFPFEMCESLQVIGASAFQSTDLSGTIVFPNTLSTLGSGAFLNVHLSGVRFDGQTDVQGISIGVKHVKNNFVNIDGFFIYGSATANVGTSAKAYAENLGFRFVNMDDDPYRVTGIDCIVYNFDFDEYAAFARENELMKVYDDVGEYKVFDGFESDEVIIDENDQFIMPDEDVTVTAITHDSTPIIIDFSEDPSVYLYDEEVDFLTDYFDYCAVHDGDDIVGYDLDGDSTADFNIIGNQAVKLASSSITSSIAFKPNGLEYSPVTFVFAENVIEEAELTAVIPNAYDYWNWQTDFAELTPVEGSHFTVTWAKWYNAYGAAPDYFVDGEKYHIYMGLKPDEGYAFTMDTEVTVNGKAAKDVYLIEEDGIAYLSSPDFYPIGEPHQITINGGIATTVSGDYAGEHKITEAHPGDTVYILPDINDVAEDEYVVQSSTEAFSDDVTIYEEGPTMFIMPNHDVTATFTYQKAKQMNSTVDLRNGPVVIPSEGIAAQNEAYGVRMVLNLTAAKTGFEFNEQTDSVDFYFDIDGDNGFDISISGADDLCTLLPPSSLTSSSGAITFTLDRITAFRLPVRSVTFLISNTTFKGDVNNDGVITIDDATMLQRHLAEYTNADGSAIIDVNDAEIFAKADVNSDNRISIRDVTEIQRIIAEIV